MAETETVEQTSYETDPAAVDWKTLAPEGRSAELDNYDNLGALMDAKKSFEVSARSKSTIPDGESTDEVWTEFYNKMAPATIEEYKYELPEGVDAIAQMDDLKTAAKDIGVSVKGFAKVAPVVDNILRSQAEAIMASYAPSGEDCVKELTSEWKGDTEKNIKLANSAFKKYGGDELTKWLEDTGIGNQPLLTKTFLKIAQATMDDELIDGSAAQTAPSVKASPYGDDFNKRYPVETPA